MRRLISKPVTLGQQVRAYSVHVYTALGVVFAFLATAEVCASSPDPRWVFLWLIIAVLIDSTDGPLARRWQVKRYAPRIDGRSIDDIVDYLTYTFVPLLLVWRLQWLPPPAGLWVTSAMIASLFGFANTAAKQEGEGLFLGFPSYWNVYAFYAGLWFTHHGPYLPAMVLGLLTILTVLPVRFAYPNLLSQPWRGWLIVTAVVWLGGLLTILPRYPAVPAWLGWVSLSYPGLYIGLSVYLDIVIRLRQRHVAAKPPHRDEYAPPQNEI